MNKQDYADKFTLSEWQAMCENGEFVDAFWFNDFEKCDKIADEIFEFMRTVIP